METSELLNRFNDFLRVPRSTSHYSEEIYVSANIMGVGISVHGDTMLQKVSKFTGFVSFLNMAP